MNTKGQGDKNDQQIELLDTQEEVKHTENDDPEMELLYTRVKLTDRVMGKNATQDHREMSLHLASTLDEIGLNTLTVKRRRHAFLCIEQMEKVENRLTAENMTSYFFGSQSEGTTTPGLKSDTDSLHCDSDYNVIENWTDWKQGKHNMLMLQEDTAPGYCRLQVLRDDVPIAQDCLLNESCVYYETGRVLLKNAFFYLRVNPMRTRNGPAQTSPGLNGLADGDRVYAMRCNDWPKQAEEFIRRRRRHGWPSHQLVEEATSHGVFLVPVGHKLSTTEPLEWRISASLAERCLMFSLNIVHIKCHVVLKILIKSCVQPRIPKCISSYHCKTALLHCTENTEPGFWREDNLLPCVIKCLEILRQWVADLFCPQFIIREENLFAGKVTTENRDLLLAIFTEMIESDGRVLLRVAIDDLGKRLQIKMNAKPLYVSCTDSLASVLLVGNIEMALQKELHHVSKSLTVKLDKRGDHIFVMRSVYQDIVKLQGMIENSNKHERHAIKSCITVLSCWLGSLIASFSLAHNQKLHRKAIQLICNAAKYDISVILKLSSIFYCSGKIKKAEKLLQTVETIFNRHTGSYVLAALCDCYEKPYITKVHSAFCHNMYALRGQKARIRFFVNCVRFSRHEIHCAPQALRHELNRDIDDAIDTPYRDPEQDEWMDLAVVDGRPFLYYLQYLTYGQLCMHELQQQSLRNLDRCAREDETLSHCETAWNLLGQCWEIEQKPDAAISCYIRSLEVRLRNNAANRHMQNLGEELPEHLARRRGVLVVKCPDRLQIIIRVGSQPYIEP